MSSADHRTRLQTAARALVLVAAIAVLDWKVDLNISFGFLYLFPMVLLGMILPAWGVVIASFFCTLLADLLDPFPFSLNALPQDFLVFAAVLGAGLFSQQSARRRRETSNHLQRLEAEAAARREAEEQLEFLVESSPAAIVTMSEGGLILLANPASHRLFGMNNHSLPGNRIQQFIPALDRVTSSESNVKFRTEMQCRGVKQNGEIFLANVFFSTYRTRTGPRLAALIVDASEELRDREESSLQQLLAGSRILAGAVAHEIRNVCGAISVIHQNLTRSNVLHGNNDFEALGSLVEALSRIASLELRQSTRSLEVSEVDVREVLDDLRIVLESYCEEMGISLEWRLPPGLPPVFADRHSLLQALLNLTKNSERALLHAPKKLISFTVVVSDTQVSIRVTDTGSGIQSLEKLFQPFQTGADSTGLGLYLSRAFMRAFRGDLRHDAGVPGCSFVIDLLRADRRSSPILAEQEDHVAHTSSIA